MSSNSRLGLRTIFQAERTVAAYLGFDNVVDLQRFVIMWPCLEAVRLLSALPGLTSQSIVFQRTAEASQSMEHDHQVVPNTEYIQHCWVVCVLIVLRHNVTVYETNTFQQNRARTIVAINRMPSRFWIPDHVLEEDDFPPHPIIRPTVRSTEPAILQLHRCLCLIQYLELSHGSEFRREIYLDARVHFSGEDFDVTEHDIPWWMRHSP
ncbi:hypothetical protein N7471_002194 [Penicillium samsonianum]|uniref:uncharacterized protein n=1 Tax=Penicillium samsonianum TaxID=1882272 RepID=UPI002548DD78|nr:uncharacterized protein N7471_002194 [Penicillium samsonianum]KAJ6142741.1 hypothetical protein N7471_002194 [Penicillium samsonianum]